MSDGRSAHTFGCIFEMLAEQPDDRNCKLARRLYGLHYELGLDCNVCEMDADAALETLGLAKQGPDPDYPEDGDRTLYLGEDYGKYPKSGMQVGPY